MTTIKQIRETEKKSHIETYTSTTLFEAGSWLSKPIKTVLDVFPYFERKSKFRGLDLGCGIGRNCIPLAQYLKHCDCKIDCVDLLEQAIIYLRKYSLDYKVDECINGIVKEIETFEIKKVYYDLVLGISSLEHVENKEVFHEMLIKIQEGVKQNGIVCFVINSEVEEVDCLTKQKLTPQFEVNLPTQELKECLENVYAGWKVLKYSVTAQEYDIPRENMVHLTTKVVTWVARKI